MKTGNVLHFTWKEHKYGLVGPAAERGKGYFVYKAGENGIAELDGPIRPGRRRDRQRLAQREAATHEPRPQVDHRRYRRHRAPAGQKWN